MEATVQGVEWPLSEVAEHRCFTTSALTIA